MTISDVIMLHESGKLEEAYKAMCLCYASDKSRESASVMFQIAADVLEKCIDEKRFGEGEKIMMALDRLQKQMPAVDGSGQQRMAQLALRFSDACPDFPKQRYACWLDALIHLDDDVPGHLALGQWGERVAQAFLQSKGYAIVSHDWKSGHRDIDLIARKDGICVFVEVKTRTNSVFQQPEEAVNYQKMLRLRKSINHYVKLYQLAGDIRFDIISVIGPIGTFPDIRHLEDVPILNFH